MRLEFYSTCAVQRRPKIKVHVPTGISTSDFPVTEEISTLWFIQTESRFAGRIVALPYNLHGV
jgi:hypothetical protein